MVRWTNLICAALLIVAALGFLLFLPENIADYAREPEDVWLGSYWIAGLSLLAALCFANARRAARPPRSGWLTVANLAAVSCLALLLLLGREDPALVPLVAVCVLGPVVALIGIWRVSPVEQS